MTNQNYDRTNGAPLQPAGGHIQGMNASPGGLVRSTFGSMAAAFFILILFWLPSEYGVDPTGVGRLLGLTQMGEIKQQLYAEAADEDAVLAAQAAAERVSADPALLARLDALEGQVSDIADALGVATASPVSVPQAVPSVTEMPEPAAPQWRDEVSYTLSPAQGIEIKLAMTEGARAIFAWTANGSVLNYDTHGDGGWKSISYEQGRGVPEQTGELVAAFDGKHGWFWRNRTESAVKLTLRIRGDYSELITP